MEVRDASDYWDGLPAIARRASKFGYWPDGPDFDEARAAPCAVPGCNTRNPAPPGNRAGTGARDRWTSPVAANLRDPGDCLVGFNWAEAT